MPGFSKLTKGSSLGDPDWWKWWPQAFNQLPADIHNALHILDF